jgi:tyrosyl-tRNA synthetase
MSKFKSDFLRTLAERGFIHQISHEAELDAAAAKGGLTAYIGFDCTAPSLHVGSLVQIMLLRWLQKTGGRPIALMGGGTTKVGDPTGKDESRKMLSAEDIDANMAGIKGVFGKFMTFGTGKTDAVMVNNDDWLSKLAYIDFLRDYGRHFSVNRMLTFDSVKLRLEREQSFSFLEFNYMILQAYDFLELNRRHGCQLQMGGSDQWGNIINGVELVRRVDAKDAFALTTPLLTTSAGAKMGKTAAGAVWLNADMLKPYEYWQFWRNTEDADVGRFLKLFTDLPLAEVERLAALAGAEINEAKKVLANEATAMLHGRQAADDAAAAAKTTFEQGGVAAGLPTVVVPELTAGVGVLSAFVTAGLVPSTSEARRQIKAGGLRVNDVAVTDEKAVLSLKDAADGVVKLSMGKKKHVLLKV